MDAYWKLQTTDAYRLHFGRSLWNLFRGREVPIDAHFIPATYDARASLELYCDSEVNVVDDGSGKSYTPLRKSSRLAIQDIETAGSDRAPLKKKTIEGRLREHGVRPIDLWNANRDQVNQAYRDAFEVLISEACHVLGAHTGFVFRSGVDQERIMRELILPKSVYVKKEVPAERAPQVNQVKS